MLFRQIEDAWASRKKTKHWKPAGLEPSPCKSQGCHAGGDLAGTQTFPIKQSTKSVAHNPYINGDGGTSDRGGHAKKEEKRQTADREGLKRSRPDARPHDAAAAAAERRWSTALHDHFSSSPDVYGQVIGAIDQEMQSAATAAEMNEHGAGIACILQLLRAQGLERPMRNA